MKDMPYEGKSSYFLLFRRETSLLQAVSGIIPSTILEVADVKLRNEQAVLHLTELVTIINNKLSYILDA